MNEIKAYQHTKYNRQIAIIFKLNVDTSHEVIKFFEGMGLFVKTPNPYLDTCNALEFYISASFIIDKSIKNKDGSFKTILIKNER